ncbi:MAG: type II secretion system protein, partial [Limisphaerales bacterium]
MKNKLPVLDCQFSDEMEGDGFVCLSTGNRWSQIKNYTAFTLIELLTVIAIIGVLAALLFPAFSAVKKHALINHAQAEMAQLETAIGSYKAAYGFYPPSNTNTFSDISWARTNQLYFELSGTTNNGGIFQTLDDGAEISSSEAGSLFGVDGFINCNKPGASDDAPKARNFLPDLKPNQTVTYTTNPPPNVVKILVSSVGGPDASYSPLGAQFQGINPWRYNSY